MKINVIFKVNDVEVPIVSIALTIDRDAPGRGIVAVQAEAPLSGTVTLDAGINGVAKRYFTGYVANSVPVDRKQQRLLIREAGALLANRAPIALRNVKLADAVFELSKCSGLRFAVAGDWPEKPVAHFINLGSGDEALRLIGALSGVADFSQLYQADGSIYLGGAGATRLAGTVLRFDAQIFTNLSSSGADCAFLPALRPGMRLTIGDSAEHVISAITLTGEKLRLNLEQAQA